MLKKLILTIGVILILGYFGLNVLKGDIPSKSIVNVSLQSSIESFRNKFEQIKPLIQKRMAEQLEDTKSIGELMERIKEAKTENNLRRVNEYLDKGLELLNVKLPETETETGERFIEKAIQSKMKLFNDTVNRKREVKQYNDKIGMVLQRSVFLARAGNIDSANGLIDIAMFMAKYGPIAIDENERDKLKV